ncbi:MAG: hydrogenase maturation protease [Candidatus Aminicenantes bacterium]|nr:hydrogenase maturation protease [Candidatus Aminicenantes bacterium]
MKTLILGMGNPILCDDGVGLHIARALEDVFPDSTVATATMIDLQLLEILTDYDRLFIVDALLSIDDDIGTVKKLPPEHETMHLFSSHGLHFFELLKLGRQLGYKLPEIGGIYGVVIEPENSFGTAFSPQIKMKLKSIIREIAADIKTLDFG